MKKTPPDQPPIDLIRLPDTQADGDFFRSTSLRPNGDLQPVSLSESNDDVETQQEKKQQQQKQQNKQNKQKNKEQKYTDEAQDSLPTSASGSSVHEHNNSHTGYNNAHANNTPGSNASADTQHVRAPSNSAAFAVSPAPTSVQAARPRSLIEDVSLPSSRTEKETARATNTTLTSHGSTHSSNTTSTNDNGSSSRNRNRNANSDHDSSDNAGGAGEGNEKKNQNKITALVVSFFSVAKDIMLYSWLNVLLIFVPVGIAVGAVPGLSPAVVFSMNAIAIVPLAGLLAYATESVAHKMGDSIGALLNVTFGNAVELIIFIALVKGEIRIVQASLLGSILANLLLILGMGFLFGGLRYREQIYNSTVTQMSACLLSLSVISLVLPTAFHASFSDTDLADRESLKISRATSVVLLLVYLIYLVFQLKSHAYMYESTPQHIIDEEAEPGPAVAWLDSSSSDDSSSSSSDSDDSSHSRDTMKKRMRRAIRSRRRRVSSVASLDTVEGSLNGPTRTPSFGTATAGTDDTVLDETTGRPVLLPRFAAMNMSEEAVDEDDVGYRRHRKRHQKRSLRRYRKHKHKSSRLGAHDQDVETENTIMENTEASELQANGNLPAHKRGESSTMAGSTTAPSGVDVANGETRRVDFALTNDNLGGGGNSAAAAELASARRAFHLRAMSFRPVAKSLAPSVFTQPPDTTTPAAPAGPVPRVRFGIRRTNSLPDRLNQQQMYRAPGAMMPAMIPTETLAALSTAKDTDKDGQIMLSRKAAVIMLLISTGLVAACAEFMVDSINGLVASSSVGEVFIGLIILPIVGNAAEHVTAVVVAMKNKMDLAIGVAVGSSIQIALFMTPLVVILGWIMDRDMTLYFTLFETVCLFVSAFIVNFLVLDGRSNYLEGALLLATYVIISVLAYYYPAEKQASAWGR